MPHRGAATTSDRRLKRVLVHLGDVAQEVQAVLPEAVIVGPEGYLFVDYDKIFLRDLPAHLQQNVPVPLPV